MTAIEDQNSMKRRLMVVAMTVLTLDLGLGVDGAVTARFACSGTDGREPLH